MIIYIKISIPYGAIKSGEFKTEFESYTKFQFLMVRLKGRSTRPIFSFAEISIPYGAIKRF